ncbi:VOC family protein [Riemerella columbina]|uniref:VOC family protein n=1 Tax=Riemerella columbina TaxID=103810 RepID=UPI00035FBBF9|nr:VOC family protein [Riemerella columbina]
MTTVNIYLTFGGNCLEAFRFYQSVFGGEFSNIKKFTEMPLQEADTPPISENDKDKIMHISLPISKETLLMGSDTFESFGQSTPNIGNNFSISVQTDNKEDAYRIFEALSSDGKVKMPLEKAFWGDYFGMLTDKFGINWMINVDLNT